MNAVVAPTEKHAHLVNRAPRRNDGFSWGRFQVPESQGRGVTYRLFRRSLDGKLHMVDHVFYGYSPRAGIAAVVWRMRIELREAVDAVDFKHMGVV